MLYDIYCFDIFMKSIKITILSILFVSAIALSSSAQCTERPAISAQPINTVTCNGSSASFSVGQSGGTSYQWYWRGSSGSSSIVPKTYPWSGYNSSMLTIAYNSASPADILTDGITVEETFTVILCETEHWLEVVTVRLYVPAAAVVMFVMLGF